jgi:hypothetical protein
MRLVAVFGVCALSGCLHDDSAKVLGPDTAIALHFDSLSAQASASSQENRVAALNLALRAMADGTTPGLLILSNGLDAKDTATFTTVSWTMASVVTNSSAPDSVKDSLLVFVGWRGANADTMVVVRSGNPGLAPQVQSELAILGLANHLVTSDTTDTVTSGALVAGNTVAVADSGAIEGDFGVFGAVCEFVTVSSIANDNVSGQTCNRELLLWQFGLRFSPSVRWSLSSGYSPGVVVVH